MPTSTAESRHSPAPDTGRRLDLVSTPLLSAPMDPISVVSRVVIVSRGCSQGCLPHSASMPSALGTPTARETASLEFLSTLIPSP